MSLVRDVFVAGGMPSVTYVERASISIEKKLRSEIAEGYKIICVTGPTKSGKTVLTRHVLGRDKSAVVNGGHVKTGDEFWVLLLQELNIPSSESVTSGGEASIGIKYLISAQAKASEGVTQTFNNNNKRHIFRYLIDNRISLVVDDFHYIPHEVQKDIVRSLKSEIFDGLIAILIAVPHRAFDVIGVEREMEGRFAHIEIPTWGQDELKIIPNKGFIELRMRVPEECCSLFAAEAFGSPLLMQRFCLRLCIHYDISETLQNIIEYNPSKDVREEIFESVSSQFGLPSFDKLSKGPQSRKKRMDRKLSNEDVNLDIYQCVLKAIANSGPKEKLHYNEIRDELRKIIVDTDIPQKHEVSSALGQMSSIAKEKIEGEPVLEWSDDYVYLTDPFLMFYMRWSQRDRR